MSDYVQTNGWLNTGILTLDAALSDGRGIPLGRMIEAYGLPGVGKTALIQYLLRQVQKAGGIGVYMDFENSMDESHLKSVGIDMGKLVYVDVETIENGMNVLMDQLRRLLSSNIPVLVVWDSIALSVPKGELEEDKAEDNHMGLQSRALGKLIRKIRRILRKTNCTVIFVNQIRDKPGVMFGDNTTTPGGHALKFASSLRINLHRMKGGTTSKTVKGTKIQTGMFIAADIKKSRFSTVGRSAKIYLSYNKGIDPVTTLKAALKDMGLLRKSPSGDMIYTPTKETFKTAEWNAFYKRNRKDIRARIQALTDAYRAAGDDDEGSESGE